jgi:hypothetical protein
MCLKEAANGRSDTLGVTAITNAQRDYRGMKPTRPLFYAGNIHNGVVLVGFCLKMTLPHTTGTGIPPPPQPHGAPAGLAGSYAPVIQKPYART